MKTYLLAIFFPDGSTYSNTVDMSHELWIQLDDVLNRLQEDGRIKGHTVHLIEGPISKTQMIRDLFIFGIDLK